MTSIEESRASPDWCRSLRELIALQREQLAALNADGQHRLTELAAAFEVLVGSVETSRIGDDPAMRDSMAAAVRTLQFADNQAQRLEHLLRALDQMNSLLASPAHADGASWDALRAGVRASYTMERECEVYDRLFRDAAAPAPAGGDAGAPRGVGAPCVSTADASDDAHARGTTAAPVRPATAGPVPGSADVELF